MAKLLPFDRRRATPDPLVMTLRARRLTVDDATKAWASTCARWRRRWPRQNNETKQRLRKAGAAAIAAEWAAITAERAAHRTRDPS